MFLYKSSQPPPPLNWILMGSVKRLFWQTVSSHMAVNTSVYLNYLKYQIPQGLVLSTSTFTFAWCYLTRFKNVKCCQITRVCLDLPRESHIPNSSFSNVHGQLDQYATPGSRCDLSLHFRLQVGWLLKRCHGGWGTHGPRCSFSFKVYPQRSCALSSVSEDRFLHQPLENAYK